MILQGNQVYLRDPVLEDMKDFEQWYQPNQEWLQWDAPWIAFQPMDFAVLRANIANRIQQQHTGMIRDRLELCTNAHKHIGWMSWYYIHGDRNKLAIGIDIVDNAHRGKGYGHEAYVLFCQYLIQCSITRIYTQTWSGNVRMIHLAHKTCFVEVDRQTNYLLVQGQYYDEITFQLDVASFMQAYPY